jgi:curved DNA-binding protein CbpA
MNWLTIGILGFAFVLGLSRYYRRATDQAIKPAARRRQVAPDEKAKAVWKSDDMDEMLKAAKVDLGPADRNQLLTSIVEKAYKERKDPKMRKIFHRFARIHVEELPRLAPALKEQHGGELPPIPTFKDLAIALEEEKRYDEAVSVCEQAVGFNMEDGTKTGFAGRIERLRKKKQG